MSYSPLLVRLIDGLRCMPGVGQKSAQRIAFHLLERDREGADITVYESDEGGVEFASIDVLVSSDGAGGLTDPPGPPRPSRAATRASMRTRSKWDSSRVSPLT